MTPTSLKAKSAEEGYSAGSPLVVTRTRLEQQLEYLSRSTKDPAAGLFGPGSMTWRINREAGVFLGAGRAALLQCAHPWVAAALTQHSSVASNPVRRFRGTFAAVFPMLFGSLEHALKASRTLHAMHSRIRGFVSDGDPDSGQRYYANNVEALGWVFATLVDTSIRAYELLLPKLTISEKARYYEESKRFAKLFGLSDEDLPSDWRAFLAYNEKMWSSETLQAIPATEQLRDLLLYGKRTEGLRLYSPSQYRILTVFLLPEPIRALYDLHYHEREARAADRILRRTKAVYQRLPRRLRFVPAYQEAVLRLRGLPGPDYLTRALNRLWIGKATIIPQEFL